MPKRKTAKTKIRRSRRPALIEWGLFVEYKQNKKGTRKHPISFDLIVRAPEKTSRRDILRMAVRELPESDRWRAKLLKPAWVTFSKGSKVTQKKKTKVRSYNKPKRRRKK